MHNTRYSRVRVQLPKWPVAYDATVIEPYVSQVTPTGDYEHLIRVRYDLDNTMSLVSPVHVVKI